MGKSVSYNRVLELSTQLGNNHNPTFTTARGSFHGTGISLFQHPRNDSVGVAQNIAVVLAVASNKVLGQLPDNYRCVPPTRNDAESQGRKENEGLVSSSPMYTV
ncbi:hypothetical protein MAR_024127 [Mya arenaria]|uniref:Uncharacterized protein n=1 Tax=Mya arenaria TaxID=6604 RepID=A0ABY7DT18_MYAAR|nr:hypothetical protein MAR_024127 [Mya arenaria]